MGGYKTNAASVIVVTCAKASNGERRRSDRGSRNRGACIVFSWRDFEMGKRVGQRLEDAGVDAG